MAGLDNIFTNIPAQLPEELFTTLVKSDDLHIERIVSRGHANKKDAWYDQQHDEWVILLQGEAIIEFTESGSKRLQPGDYIHIPAHCKHRVDWTCPDIDCIWLAVHFRNSG